MPTLSIREIYDAARSAGFTPHQAVTWTAIAMAESGGRTGALNAKGEHSMGLWQINVASGVRTNKWGNLNDPSVNARAAYEISRNGRDMRPWTTTHDHNKGTAADYRRYLGKVESEIGVKGDPRGVGGYHSAMLEPLPEAAGYDQIDTGATLTAVNLGPDPDAGRDADADGLTDAFEKIAGTNAKKADSDRDGLSDGYEASASHTDPLAVDTDGDGLSDPAELAAGSDAGRLPGVAGVVGVGPFAENVRGGVQDADADGLSDHTEKLVGLDLKRADTDNDQLSDASEAALGTDPTRADSDHDGVTDGMEAQQDTDPLGPQTNPDGTTSPTKPWTLQDAYTQRHAAQVATPAATEKATSSKLDTFLAEARAQRGDPYIYGAQPKLADANPKSFDCSALTQWAAHQAGVKIPRTAEYQYMDLKQKNLLIPVDQALKTPGALLFYFSREPTSSLPAGQAHVAISKGDGKTIEARGKAYGVGEWSAKHRFNYAGVIPGISDAKGLQEYEAFRGGGEPVGGQPAGIPGGTATATVATPASNTSAFDISTGRQLAGLPGAESGDPDTDADGLTDAFEKLVGSKVKVADTDGDGLADGYEAVTAHTDPLKADTDGDLLSDPAELAAGTDPGRLPGVGGVVGSGQFAENVRGGVQDADADGLSDRTEKLLGTAADHTDSDRDGISDHLELALGSKPTVSDTDADGVADGVELQFGTDPLATDGLPGSAAGLGVGPGAGLGAASPVGPADLIPAAAGTGGPGADALELEPN